MIEEGLLISSFYLQSDDYLEEKLNKFSGARLFNLI